MSMLFSSRSSIGNLPPPHPSPPAPLLHYHFIKKILIFTMIFCCLLIFIYQHLSANNYQQMIETMQMKQAKRARYFPPPPPHPRLPPGHHEISSSSFNKPPGNPNHPNCHIYRNLPMENSLIQVKFPFCGLRLPNNVDLIIYHFGPGDMISNSLINYGKWEAHIVEPLMEIMKQDATLQFIDIGCNLGVFTLAVASLARRVVAVDAMEMTCQRVYASILINDLHTHVTLIQNAIADKRETSILQIHNDNFGGSSLVENSTINNFPHQEEQKQYAEMKSIFMDDLLEVIDFDRAIMKIDIEGSESLAFKHASKLFDKIDIPMVLMEWGIIKNSNSSSYEIIQFFIQRQYLPFSSIKTKTSDLILKESDLWPWDIVWKK